MNSSSFTTKKSYSSSSSHVLTTFIPVALLLLLSPFLLSDHHPYSPPPRRSTIIHPHRSHPDPFVTNTCSHTLYPTLCSQTLSTFPHNLHQNNHTKLHHALHYTIQKTINRVTKTRTTIMSSLNPDVQETMWVNNCVELLRLTAFELQESVKQLYSDHKDVANYDTMKIMLSAAMTNKETCMQGFFRMKLDHNHGYSRIGRYMQKSLTPIMHMIANSLGIIRYLESEGDLDTRVPLWKTASF